MGGVTMGECKDKQRKFWIIKTNYKHPKGGYGRLPLGNVYTCHGFLQRTHELEKTDTWTFFHEIIQWIVNRGFGNLWQPTINRIYEISKTILCNSRHVNLGATKNKRT